MCNIGRLNVGVGVIVSDGFKIKDLFFPFFRVCIAGSILPNCSWHKKIISIFIWIHFYFNSFSFFLSSSILLFLASSFLSNEPKSHLSCNGSIWLFWLIEWLWDYFSIQSTIGRRWNKIKVFKDGCVIFLLSKFKTKII